MSRGWVVAVLVDGARPDEDIITFYVHDDLGRLLTYTHPLTGVVVYQYDLGGNRTGMTYPDGRVVTNTYDGDNRLVQVEDWDNLTTTYSYDGLGRLVTTTLPNGVVTVNSYDGANRLTAITHYRADGSLLASYSYTLDKMGNRLQEVVDMNQPTKMMASNGAAADNFGYDVAVAGDWMVVAADEDDNKNGNTAGAAYVYIYSDTQWIEHTIITATDGGANDYFGTSVAIYSDTIVVGARLDDEAGTNAGAAYVYLYDQGIWTETAKLTASDGGPNHQFGRSVAIYDGTIVVGAFLDNAVHGTVDGAYVFNIDANGDWTETIKLEASVVVTRDHFGQAVTITGGITDTIIVGAPNTRVDATINRPGAAYIYVLSGTTWVQQAHLTAIDNDINGFFGNSVDVEEDTAIIGAHNGFTGPYRTGTAYAFTRDGEVWTGEDEFYPANRDNLDTFGWDVALEGDTVFVGAPLHDIGMVTDTGSVYLFTREADETWTEVMAVTADDSDSNDQFGLSVALAGGHHLIGAPLDDEVGVDGGAAYWFQPGVQTTVTYTYDPLYRVVGAVYTGSVDAEFDYLYDAVGNLTVYTETITSTQVTTRTVNERNQLVLTNQGGVTTSYSYDQNGNLTNIRPAGIVTSGAKIYGYDQRNLMVTATVYVTNSYAAVADYHYDGNRTRLQQVVYSGTTPITTTYIQDLQGLAQVLVAEGSAETNYYLMGHARIAQDNGSQVRYFLADGLGSVRVEMVGSTIDTFSTYEPYGDLLHQTGSSDSVYGFAGEEYDVGTGLVYLRARYYSPELMQFMGRDGYAGQPRMPVTMHGYSYAHSNPVNLVDPSGYSPSNLLRGVIIHKMIQIEYLERYPNADIEVSIPGASVHGQYRIKKFCDSITGVSYWSLVCGWTPGMSAITNNTGRADIIKDLELFEIKPRPARDIGAITAMWYIYAYADAYNIQLTLGTSYGSKRLIGPDPMNPSKFIMAEQDVPGVITYWDVNAPTAPPPTGYVYAYNHATRRIEKKAWQFQMASNMVPQLQPVRNSGLVQVCGAAVILAGGVIIVSTLVTDIISLGAGVIDDPATITAGSTLIATGNKMMQSGAIP